MGVLRKEHHTQCQNLISFIAVSRSKHLEGVLSIKTSVLAAAAPLTAQRKFDVHSLVVSLQLRGFYLPQKPVLFGHTN